MNANAQALRDAVLQMPYAPSVFRQHLLIDCNGVTKPFRPDPWQEADFSAMDHAWMHAVGRWSGPPPEKRIFWGERPRSHSKTSDIGTMAAWAITFAARPVKGAAFARDERQSAILLEVLEKRIALNPWLGQFLSVQKSVVLNTQKPRPGPHPGPGGSRVEIFSADIGSAYGLLDIDFIIADEVSHWRYPQLWDLIWTTFGKRTNCTLSAIMNAGTLTHWSADIREKMQRMPECYFSRLRGPIASWITEQQLSEQRRGISTEHEFARLWLNEWQSSDEASVFRGPDIDACLDASVEAILV